MNSPDIPDQGTNSFKKTVFATLTLIFGAGAALIGMLGIIGMIFGIPLFTSLFPGYKTIAFSTSVIWIIFGSVLACHAATPLRGSVRTCTAALVALIAILAAVEFPLNILGKHFIVEIWAIQIADAISAQPTTPTSPVAVVLVVSAAIALFFMLYAYGPSKEEEEARDVVGILGLAISLVSFTFVLSYFYGTPFLYGTPLIPIAFTSAIAALCIGAGLVTSAGPAAIPLTYISGPSTRARLLRFFLPLTLIIILVQNLLQVTIASVYKIHDALLLALSIVIFSLLTSYVVAKVSGGVSYVIDSAERKRKGAENALREREEKYRTFFTTSRDCVFITSTEGHLVDINDVAIGLFGYDSREALQKVDVKELYADPNDRTRHLQTINEKGYSREYPVNLKKKDGTVINTLITSVARKDKNGSIIGYQGTIWDITEQKHAEEKLRESESRYRNVVEDQTEFICRFAPDGTLTFVNDAYCRYFGLKREECIGKRHSVVLPPDDLSLMKKHIRSLTLENPVATIRHRIIMPSGEVRWQRWSDRAIFDEQGELKEYQSVGRDITDVVKTEESLKENEGRLNAIIQGSPIPQFIIDRNHRVIKWNEALEKYCGIKAEEVMGTDQHWRAFYQQERPCMADLLVDEKLEKIPLWYSGKCARSNLIDDAYEATDYFPKIGKKGTWLHFTAAPIRDLNGAIIGAIETLEDITERKMAEAALHESESRYRNVVEDQTEFICRFTPEGMLTFVNDAYCRYFGLKREECIGKRHSVVLPTDDLSLMKKHIRSLTLENPVGFIEHRIIMLSGEVRWQHWSDRAIFDKDGHVVEYQSVGKDITERKMAEEALRKNQFLLAEAMDLANLVNWEFDVPSGIFTFDDRFYALYGTTPEREGGNQMSAEVYAREFVHSDDHDVVADEVNKAINTTDPQYVSQVEHRIIRRDGEIRHIVVRIGITKDANGRTIKTHGANQDITERKRAEERAVYLASFPEFTPVLILEADLHGSILYANPAIRKATETMGESDSRIFIPQDIRDRLNGTVIAESVHEIREIEIHGQVFQENVYFTPEFSSLRVYATDITERKRAEEVMQQTNEYLHKLIDFANAPIIVWNPAFRITRFNHAFEHLTGRTEQEVLEQEIDILFPAESREASFALIKKTLEGERWEAVKIPILVSDGTIRIVLWNSANILTNQADLISTIAQGIDITELERAQEHLKESEERYRNIIETAQEGIWTLDSNFHISFVNEKMAGMLGYTQHEMIGRSFAEFIPEGELPDAMMQVELRKKGMKDTYERRFLHRNGDIRTMLTSSATIYDSNGTFSGSFAMFTDITERKRVEEVLQQSEERYRAVVEDQTEFICRFTPEGMLTFVNDAYCRYFGLKREECIGKRHSVVLPTDDLSLMKKHIRSLTLENPVGFIEHRIIMLSGEVRWQRWSDRAIFDKDGHVVEYQSVGKDITERKQAQFQREALIKELEQKNAELERFTYTVSHDLKSPLITIRGFLGLLEEDVLKADTVSLKKDINRIKSATNKMEDLLRELLALSRIGRIVSPPTMVSFTTIAEDAMELLEGAIQQRELTVEIAPDMPVVNVDRDRVREAVMNLVENAIKFMGDQPHPKIEIGVRYDRDQPVFFVKDNGIGIDPQYHTKIFGLFEKLDANTGGSGTGLTIVQRIIEVHGGRIWVESAGANQGSTFYFSLPVAGADGTDTHKNEEKAE